MLDDRELRRLIVEVELGGSLLFVQADTPSAVDAVIAQLRERRPDLTLARVSMDGEGFAQRVAHAARQADIVIADGAEVVGASAAPTWNDWLRALNTSREAVRNLPATLVMMCPGWLLDAIARRAPDFWSWRSRVFEQRSAVQRSPSEPIPPSPEPVGGPPFTVGAVIAALGYGPAGADRTVDPTSVWPAVERLLAWLDTPSTPSTTGMLVGPIGIGGSTVLHWLARNSRVKAHFEPLVIPEMFTVASGPPDARTRVLTLLELSAAVAERRDGRGASPSMAMRDWMEILGAGLGPQAPLAPRLSHPALLDAATRLESARDDGVWGALYGAAERATARLMAEEVRAIERPLLALVDRYIETKTLTDQLARVMGPFGRAVVRVLPSECSRLGSTSHERFDLYPIEDRPTLRRILELRGLAAHRITASALDRLTHLSGGIPRELLVIALRALEHWIFQNADATLNSGTWSLDETNVENAALDRKRHRALLLNAADARALTQIRAGETPDEQTLGRLLNSGNILRTPDGLRVHPLLLDAVSHWEIDR